MLKQRSERLGRMDMNLPWSTVATQPWKGSRLQDSNEQLGHAMDVMPARGKETQEFMNATDRVLQRCAAVEFYVRQNAKFAWTTPFVPDTFYVLPVGKQ